MERTSREKFALPVVSRSSLHSKSVMCSPLTLIHAPRAEWVHRPRIRASSTGQYIFRNMPSLLPRETTRATSVVRARVQRPSPSDYRVGFSNSFTRLLMGSLALRPDTLLFGNSRPRVTTTPLPHATGAYGQFPGRDFNPLDTLLLLRTIRSRFVAFNHSSAPLSEQVVVVVHQAPGGETSGTGHTF